MMAKSSTEREMREVRRWSQGVKEALETCSGYDILNTAFMLEIHIDIAREEVDRAYRAAEISTDLRRRYVDELAGFLEQTIQLPTQFDLHCACRRTGEMMYPTISERTI